MDIFVFSSKNLTNIWAGIGAQLWAVADTGDSKTFKARATKSKSMNIGTFGILYCVETQSLTTPFIVRSLPDSKRRVTNVWPEEWVLPFNITTLGSPKCQLAKDLAVKELPILRKKGALPFGKVFHVQAITAFSPTAIGPDDWSMLVDRLAE